MPICFVWRRPFILYRGLALLGFPRNTQSLQDVLLGKNSSGQAMVGEDGDSLQDKPLIDLGSLHSHESARLLSSGSFSMARLLI
jgi:hypothetical protein